MKWDAKSTFQQPPVGAHVATLIKIVDIGTQTSEYQGQKTVRRQNILTWELPHELMEDGKPFIISKFYTASLSDKSTLTKDLISWLGKAPSPGDFDPQSLLGKACQVIVSERENSDKRVVSGLAPVPKGVKVPETPFNPLVFFDLDNFSQTTFDSLSDGIKNMILKSPEYLAIVNGEIEDEVATSEEDIPF